MVGGEEVVISDVVEGRGVVDAEVREATVALVAEVYRG